jgi:biopolymer transport protein ExbD
MISILLPFVDVVLVLLVIFMVTAPMMVKETMNIKLPKGKNTERSKSKTLGISISRSGQVLVNGEQIDSTLLYDLAASRKAGEPRCAGT